MCMCSYFFFKYSRAIRFSTVGKQQDIYIYVSIYFHLTPDCIITLCQGDIIFMTFFLFISLLVSRSKQLLLVGAS